MKASLGGTESIIFAAKHMSHLRSSSRCQPEPQDPTGCRGEPAKPSAFGFPAAPGPFFLPSSPRRRLTATSSARDDAAFRKAGFVFRSIWASWLQEEKPGLLSPSLTQLSKHFVLGLLQWRGALLQESFPSLLHWQHSPAEHLPTPAAGTGTGRGTGTGIRTWTLRHARMLSTTAA